MDRLDSFAVAAEAATLLPHDLAAVDAGAWIETDGLRRDRGLRSPTADTAEVERDRAAKCRMIAMQVGGAVRARRFGHGFSDAESVTVEPE